MPDDPLPEGRSLTTQAVRAPDAVRTLSSHSDPDPPTLRGEVVVPKTKQISLRIAIESFILNLEAYRRSRATVDVYRRALDRFRGFLESECGHRPELDDLTVEGARRFLLWRRNGIRYGDHPNREPGGALSPSSLNQDARNLRAFANWLHREGLTREHRLQRLGLPKIPNVQPKPLTPQEVGEMLRDFDKRGLLGRRGAAIVALLYDTGMRAGELVRLRMDDINFGTGELGVFGKGEKERTVVAGRQALRVLLRYIEVRPEGLGSANDRVFLGRTGRPMTVGGIGHIFLRLRRRLGKPRLHAHLLRHSFAVQFLRNGGDVLTLQRLMGHSSVATTNHYVLLAGADLVNVHRRASPLDNL